MYWVIPAKQRGIHVFYLETHIIPFLGVRTDFTIHHHSVPVETNPLSPSVP